MPTDRRDRAERIPYCVAVALAAIVALWVTITIQPLWTMLIPVVLAALPLSVNGRATRVVAGFALAGMCVFIVLGILSVGAFFIPSALALAVGLLWPK